VSHSVSQPNVALVSEFKHSQSLLKQISPWPTWSEIMHWAQIRPCTAIAAWQDAASFTVIVLSRFSLRQCRCFRRRVGRWQCHYSTCFDDVFVMPGTWCPYIDVPAGCACSVVYSPQQGNSYCNCMVTDAAAAGG